MKKYWNGLSLFTRVLAVVVIVASSLTLYWKLRYAPAVKTAQTREQYLDELAERIERSRSRVERLRRERAAGQKWAHYAQILDEQSTGRSLRDVLATCGTSTGPDIAVEGLRFERIVARGAFRQMKVSFRLDGSYAELVRLLHELDRAFPPIEITKADLRVPEGEEAEIDGRVTADLEGVIHEPM